MSLRFEYSLPALPLSAEQVAERLVIGFEIEAIERALVEGGDAVVAEVADRALVGVVHLLHWGELASLDVEPHLLIGIHYSIQISIVVLDPYLTILLIGLKDRHIITE